MRKLLFLFSIILVTVSACQKEKEVRYYNKFDVKLKANTNMTDVAFFFTDITGKVVYAQLDSPGIIYWYNEMKSGDVIYVNAAHLDTMQTGYINCTILNKEEVLFSQTSSFDTLSRNTYNTIVFKLPE